MSDTTLRVVEVAYDPDDNPVVHIDGWSPLQVALMQSVIADGLATYMVTSGKDSQTVEAVRADIRARTEAGQTPVLKSHLDQLGITDAVLWWSQNSG
jgi:hypothetical protein